MKVNNSIPTHMRKRIPLTTTTHILLTIIAFLLLLIAAMLIFVRYSNTPPAADNHKNPPVSKIEKPESIAIPGYEGLELKADTKKQTLCLANPLQNACYFQISLYLEDGSLLWQSQLIEPGETSKPIKLSKALEKGTYPNAVLHYACFTLDGSMTPLNGAETKLTLRVK